MSDWISCEERLPPDETPVIIARSKDPAPRIGEIRWDHPSWEETYQSYRYWDDPNDDGQCWEWDSVTHWVPLPDLPLLVE